MALEWFQPPHELIPEFGVRAGTGQETPDPSVDAQATNDEDLNDVAGFSGGP